MGYHTEFRGVLKFTAELTTLQLATINQLLGKDCRNYPEWGAGNLTYIDLKLLDDFSGLEWDGSEKPYNMPEQVNFVVAHMRKQYPDFGLSGVLSAQGSEVGDLWELYIAYDGLARKRTFVKSGNVITCPHCAGEIVLEERKEGTCLN